MRYVTSVMSIVLLSVITASSPAAEQEGFTSLFDGKSLSGWSGDSKFWSVEDGTITGRTTEQVTTDHNTFLVWTGGTVDDFQLEVDFRLVGGNSGIQYRSRESEKWVIGGYQADFDANGKYTGILYEERGRGILAMRGNQVVIGEDGKLSNVGKTASESDILAAVKKDQWNHYTVIAKGNHLIHKINGLVTVEVTDNQEDKRSMSGLLAFQVHAGPPMLVQFRNVHLKTLASADDAGTVALFNGKDLAGWTFDTDEEGVAMEDVWSVDEEGVLNCVGNPRGSLRTKKEDYSDYVLTVEWRWPGQGGNNGVLVHASTPRALGVWPKSIEVQLAADNAGDFWVIGTELDVENEASRVKGRRHINLTDGSEKPLSEWNQMEITCRGDEVLVKVNGQLVNHATNCNVTEGAICLQSEGTPIQFRNVHLRPLK